MSHTLQFSFSSSRFNSSMKVEKMKIKRLRTRCFHVLCSSERSSFEDNADNGGGQVSSRVILVERYSNGDDSQLQTFLVDDGRSTRAKRFQDSHSPDEKLLWLPDTIKDFILPAGFPGSVSDDYLHYMLLQFPTNVTGWICHTLVTSSLLKAVGVGSFSGSTAAASAAAIRWVSKDGIGAVGRLFIGGRFGSLFDDDPKQWRMYADFIGSAGSIFDLTTQLYPGYFLPLASLGNLTKAVARGLKDPSFRVIQNHFAISGNLGEVAAKEEVWEVVAQLVGLALGILILDTPGLVKSYGVLSLTWLSMRVLHLWLRYESLSVLQFNTRETIIGKIKNMDSMLPRRDVYFCFSFSVTWIDKSKACSHTGKIIHVTFYCSRMHRLQQRREYISLATVHEAKNNFWLAIGENGRCGEISLYEQVEALLKLYASEKYILMVNQQPEDLRFYVSFKVGATSVSVLRSVWQTFWLNENWDSDVNISDQIANSLMQLEEKFEDFIQKLKDAEWDTQQLNLKVPKNLFIDDNTNPL
ncbi:protein root UVB sensitive 5 isoform X1 [Vigna radiata var. radiata]|uniref:Protein root UVB sensitive 5 isoform X1 n=1 Tax=Vigna radiata var. radiata TaxID=3916 RepID=A0A3Q0F986_VIGRR|nr:protein root UVB sensitive 5 isoform X1 [Vigna radiata var. radiata]